MFNYEQPLGAAAFRGGSRAVWFGGTWSGATAGVGGDSGGWRGGRRAPLWNAPVPDASALSVVTMAIVTWASIQAIRRNLDAPPVRRAALLLLSLTFSQLLLGVGSYMNLLVADTLEWFPMAHTVMGIAVLGSAVALAATVYRRVRPEDAELAHGGVAIA